MRIAAALGVVVFAADLRRMTWLGGLSIISPMVVAIEGLILLITVAVVGLARRLRLRLMSGLAALFLVALTLATAVNAHYAYYPTLGTLWGQPSPIAAPASTIHSPVSAEPLPAHGALVSIAIPGLTSGFRARKANVYLPPAWFGPNRRTLPVLELLHGSPGMPTDWTRAAQAELTADRYAKHHQGMAPVMLMPDLNRTFRADTECVDGRQGAAETYLAVDVPQWAIRHLQVTADRSHWAVGGLSEGGTCAVNLALRHPHRFSTFLAFSAEDHISHPNGLGALFDGTPAEVAARARDYDPRTGFAYQQRTGPTRAWFEVGAADGTTTRQTCELARLARGNLTETSLTVVPGARHDFRLWRRSFADALPWLMAPRPRET